MILIILKGVAICIIERIYLIVVKDVNGVRYENLYVASDFSLSILKRFGINISLKEFLVLLKNKIPYEIIKTGNPLNKSKQRYTKCYDIDKIRKYLVKNGYLIN